MAGADPIGETLGETSDRWSLPVSMPSGVVFLLENIYLPQVFASLVLEAGKG